MSRCDHISSVTPKNWKAPVIGLAFRLIARLKESRLPVCNHRQKRTALIGTLLRGLAAALLLIHQYRF